MSRCHAPRRDNTRCRNEGCRATYGFYCERHMDRVGIKSLKTKESRKFWAGIEEDSREINTWPAWRRAGINVVTYRSEPR